MEDLSSSPNSLPFDALAASLTLGPAMQEAPSLGGDAPAGGGAQPGATGAPGTIPQGGPPPAGGFNPMFIIVLGMTVFLVVMIFSGSRRQKREQRERQSMLDALKRNDKVQTIGGIIGSVAEVRNDEVVLKVDDAGQHKIRFARSAIQQVISSRGGPAEPTADSPAAEEAEPATAN